MKSSGHLQKKKLNFNKKIKYYKHHLSHAASTFFPSGFKKSSILILDGMGEDKNFGLLVDIFKFPKFYSKIKLLIIFFIPGFILRLKKEYF
tara:strand:- start:50 stop:322 length:273 start_codon:yes stop_codon:yes gene_type:complete